jgi:hypothetical protein
MKNADVKETLEALIPAIMEIEGGYYSTVCEFISDANRCLAGVDYQYRFESTSKVDDGEGWGDTINVDTITVVECNL